MKAVLEFSLPEEREEFDSAANGWKWQSVVWDFDQMLREKIKHGNQEELVPVREALNDLITDHGLVFGA